MFLEPLDGDAGSSHLTGRLQQLPAYTYQTRVFVTLDALSQSYTRDIVVLDITGNILRQIAHT